MSSKNTLKLKVLIKNELKEKKYLNLSFLNGLSKIYGQKNIKECIRELNLSKKYTVLCPNCHSHIGYFELEQLSKTICCQECLYEFFLTNNFEKVYTKQEYKVFSVPMDLNLSSK